MVPLDIMSAKFAHYATIISPRKMPVIKPTYCLQLLDIHTLNGSLGCTVQLIFHH